MRQSALERETARRGRVIVAEDDGDLRGLIAAALRADGHHVVEATSGTQLANVILKHAIRPNPDEKLADVIISDVHMPGCSGLQVLADMRGRSWAPPVILVTALTDAHIHEEGKRLGASAIMDKPIDISNLMQLVSQLVRD
jgi:two-component system response regulator (stage 0 sporulation protein F)